MSTITVTARGQVTLPKDLLKYLGVAQGDKLAVEKLPDGRIAIKVAPRGKISDVFGCLKKPGRRALSVEQMNRTAARGWADRNRHKKTAGDD